MTQTEFPTAQKPLRLWPGVVIVILQWLVRFGALAVNADAVPFAVLGGLAGGVAVVVWWLFFSRAPWTDRLCGAALITGAPFAMSRLAHESLATGAQGMLFPILAIPIVSLAFVAWAVSSQHLSTGPRRVAMVATVLLAYGAWTLVRTGGITGNFDNDLHWRWTETPEERLLARAHDAPAAPVAPAPAAVETPQKQLVAAVRDLPRPVEPAPVAVEPRAEWPGFRGPGRDGVVRGVRIETDWSKSPPVELWRRPIGPGWSSFAVRGELLYTQEQRGPDEVVACYKLTTGEPVWTHRDAARFWESNGGAGPRGTPTLANGRVYTFGATGIVNALDAATGAVVWSHNAGSDTETKVPGWGFASSPLVVDDVVIIATSGKLVAYDRASGERRWINPARGGGYSSPHLLRIDGVAQVLLLSGAGAISVAPADGSELWEHKWASGGAAIVQPALASDGAVLISNGDSNGGGAGIRRIAVAYGSGGWTAEERWTSVGLKPYFNDFVVHNGHAFGFDGNILSCIDLSDGKRKWKGGRYGSGQMMLLRDQDLLLVLSEEGELALVGAASDKFTEVARFKAIEGKTWNHPVLAGDMLLVRNSEEMAAFRLAVARR